MKKYTLLLLALFSLEIQAEDWQLKNINFQTENDADVRDDGAYSYGGGISTLFYRKNSNQSILHIPFTNYSKSDNYISFGFAHQLYTPQDFENPNLILKDRPYAGYMYLQSGLYQSLNNNLTSLNIQVGIVGPSSQMESVQKLIHSLIGSPDPQGWEHQIKDELIFQLNFSQKKYYNLDNIFGLNYSSSILPEYGIELGNASTKIYTSALFRWGKNTPQDYGAYVIDNTNYSKISLKSEEIYKSKKWRYYINFSLKANAIAKNIFLDGNSYKESHSVKKNNFTLDVGYGLSFAYKDFSIDYIRRHTSKEFKTQEKLYSYGTLLFSYSY